MVDVDRLQNRKQRRALDEAAAVKRVQDGLERFIRLTCITQGKPLKIERVVRVGTSLYLLTSSGRWTQSRSELAGYTTHHGQESYHARRHYQHGEGVYALDPMVALGVVTREDADVFKAWWWACYSIPAEPDEVYVSYVVPVTEEPHVDDGHGEPKSRIERVGGVEDGLPTYRYSIDTSDFPSGDGWWRFWAVGRRFRGGRDARVGKFRINEAPPQL